MCVAWEVLFELNTICEKLRCRTLVSYSTDCGIGMIAGWGADSEVEGTVYIR